MFSMLTLINQRLLLWLFLHSIVETNLKHVAAICLSIPTNVPCYNSIATLTKELYTSLSYKSDYAIFLQAQDFVSKGDYENAFSTLNEISIYSQFYSQAQSLGKQINDFIFNQKELQKRRS